MITIELSKPIKLGTDLVSALTFTREAEMGDLIAGEIVGKQNGETGRLLAIYASMLGVSYIDLKKLTMKDFGVINKNAEIQALLGNDEKPGDGTQ